MLIEFYKVPILTCGPFQPFREVTPTSGMYNEAVEECFLASTYLGQNSEIKAVQTAFSSIDLTSTKKRFHRNEIRKTKSQANLNKNNLQLQDEILEWLQEIYSVQKAKLWSEKLKRLAGKLKKPGGEEKIKSKIKKFLKKVPSHFSDDDEVGQQFREQLPDYIVRKLKKIYLKNKKSKSKTLQYYTYAVPNIYTNDRSKHELNMRTIIKNWLNNIPMKKKDFIGRPIKKEDILDSIVQRLQPFIVYRPDCNKDYKCMLKSYITEILNEIPIENDIKKDKSYLNAVTGELVYNILKINRKKKNRERSPETKLTESVDNIYDKGSKEQAVIYKLEEFVAREISRLLKVTGLVTNKSRIACMEMEIVGILLDAINEIYREDEVKFDICDVLKEVGRLPGNRAKSLSNEITHHFIDAFSDIICKPNARLGNAYSETYLVCYNSPDETDRLVKLQISEKCLDACLKAYAKQISSQIEQWLFIVKDQLPITHHSTFREMAVTELADTIVKRFKYLELHPSVRGSVVHESEHLKFLIFKWIRKLAGEDKIQVIQHVPVLMKRIQMVPVPVFKSKSQDNEKNMKVQTSSNENKYLLDAHIVKELYVEIFDWYYDLPYEFHYGDDRKVKKEYIKKLAENIEKNIKIKGCLDDVIDEEVDSWANKVLKKLPRSLLLEELKARIKNVYTEDCKADASMQVTTTTNNVGTKIDLPFGVSQKLEINNYEETVSEQINEWLSRMSITIFDTKMLRWAIKNLAADIIDRQKYLEMNPKRQGNDNAELENLKYQIFKWLNKVVSEDNMIPIAHAPELMRRLKCIKISSKHDQFTKGLENKYFLTNDPSFETIRAKATSSKFESTRTSSTESNILATPDYNRRHRGFSGRHGRIEPYLSINRQQEMKRLTEYSENSHSPSVCFHDSSWEPNQARTTPIRRRWSKTRNSVWVHQAHSKYSTDYSTFTLSGLRQGPFGVRKLKGCKSMYYANEYTDVYTLSIVGRSKKSDFIKDRKSSFGRNLLESRLGGVPTGMSLSEAYEYFDQAIRKICDDIPLDESTPDNKAIADLKKKTLYNGIWKTYFKLKSDPNIENDYTVFEDTLEARLDLLLDDMQTFMSDTKVMGFRHAWKGKVVLEVTKLLEYVHSITDALPFRTILIEKFDRLFIQQYGQQASDLLQHMFIMKIIDEYILSLRYKTEDPVIANVYKQRLMRNLEELAQHIKDAHSFEYSHVNTDQLSQEAYRVLGSVPLPDDDTLIEEANEILLGEEIEQWYNELPVISITCDLDNLMRHRVKEILIKKLSDIQRLYGNDKDMIDKEMMREVTEFLKKDAQLQETHRINVDFMAKELTNRLAGMKIRALDHNRSGLKGLFLTSVPVVDKRKTIVSNELAMENLPLGTGVPVASQMMTNVGGLDASENFESCPANANESDGVCCRIKAAARTQNGFIQSELTQNELSQDEQVRDGQTQDRRQNSRFEPSVSEAKRSGTSFSSNVNACPAVYRSSEESENKHCECLVNTEGIYTLCKQKTMYW